MKFSTTLSFFLLSGSFAYASTLSVYQDKTFYRYLSQSSYIGVTKGVKAKCDGNSMGTHFIPTCPQHKRLCIELLSYNKTEQKLYSLKANAKVLEQLVSLPQPQEFDASAWVESARVVGEEQSRLLQETKKTTETLNVKKRALQRQAPSYNALISDQICSNEIELTIPSHYLSFSTFYEADIKKEKEITVTQYISIVNRSGVDVKADSAMFYYRAANQYVRPVHFNPWIVSKFKPRPTRRMMKKSIPTASSMRDESLVNMSIASPAPVERAVASYVDAREYKIDHLDLPSTGLPIDVQVTSWTSPLSCTLKVYPYVNTRVFQVCSFEPKYQIDSHNWKVKEDKVTLNEHAVGEYRKGKYNVYTKVEEDIKVLRKTIVRNERETGIFGGTVRKKDGFMLTLINKSEKEKIFTLVDRIPESTTEEIKVKLLKIKSVKKVNYKMLKEGQIEMHITLGAKETKKIEVLFEISYDKELKVRY